MNRIVLYIIGVLWGLHVHAQTDIRKYIDKGNALYEKQDFRSAAVTYKHACILDSTSFDAWFNFGNALYKLQKYILAGDAYSKALQNTPDAQLQAQTLYALGNAYMKQEDFLENFANQFDETDASEITIKTAFKDLEEWSSLLSLSIIAMCDEEYDVKIKGDDIRNAVTVEDLYNIVVDRKQ